MWRKSFFFEVGKIQRFHKPSQNKFFTLGTDFLNKLHEKIITDEMSDLVSLIDFLLLMEFKQFCKAMKRGYLGAV